MTLRDKVHLVVHRPASVTPRISANGVPRCTEYACPSFDGKRCRVLGFRPELLCEPAVVLMAESIGGGR